MSTIDEEKIIKAFGKVLKAKREEAGLSQEQLAFSIDSHFTHISRLENGHKQPTLTMIYKLSNVLKINPDQLLLDLSKALV